MIRRTHLSFLILPLWWGQLNIKWNRNSLFSERHGYVPTWRIGPFRITWRRYHKETKGGTREVCELCE